MPFTDLAGAARLCHRIDEILALVRSWPGSLIRGDTPTLRQFTKDGLGRFDDLDAKIGGLMHAMGADN
jgi:hypothetical protein